MSDKKQRWSAAIAWAKKQKHLSGLADSLRDLKEHDPQGFISAMNKIAKEYEMSQKQPKGNTRGRSSNRSTKEPKKGTYGSKMLALVKVQHENERTALADAEIESKERLVQEEVDVLKRVFVNTFEARNAAKMRLNEAVLKIKKLKAANDELKKILKVYEDVERSGGTLGTSDAEAKARYILQVIENNKELIVAEKIKRAYRGWFSRKIAKTRIIISNMFSSEANSTMATIEEEVYQNWKQQQRQRGAI